MYSRGYSLSTLNRIKREKPRAKVPRVRKRGSKTIPIGARLIPSVPEADYFSDVTGVYYHFKKMEWRTICKDPFNNSKRWQKTYGISKYGFYEAKRLAELKAHETVRNNQISNLLGRHAAPAPDTPPPFPSRPDIAFASPYGGRLMPLPTLNGVGPQLMPPRPVPIGVVFSAGYAMPGASSPFVYNSPVNT